MNMTVLESPNQFLDSREGRRQVNRILHGFPSPRFWQPEALSVPDVIAGRADARPDRPPLQLYIGVPFCIRTDPDRCGYCLFPVEVFEGAHQLDTYLDHVELEGELFRSAFGGVSLDSIYIGGGTPNLMRAAQFGRMIDIIHGMYPALAASTPLTLEGIPQLFTREKLAHLRGLGVNRISMGVQQVNTELNRLSGRRQTTKHVLDAVSWCRELELQCNVDLIFGWPQQTIDTMLHDLEQIIALGVDHIAHYELNIGGPSDFSLNRRSELPSPELTREMYRIARDFLTSNGYRQLTAYDFQRIDQSDGFVYEECGRTFERRETWGWGFAAITDVIRETDDISCTYVNHRKVEDYYAAVQAGVYPVERGFVRSATDHRLHALFRCLQGMSVDRVGYRDAFGVDVVDEFDESWTALVDRGWASITSDEIRLLGDGVYHIPLIQELLSRDRVDELCSAVIGM
jgi:oxygen-independent coproporphyrinogen-3 oxidase